MADESMLSFGHYRGGNALDLAQNFDVKTWNECVSKLDDTIASNVKFLVITNGKNGTDGIKMHQATTLPIGQTFRDYAVEDEKSMDYDFVFNPGARSKREYTTTNDLTWRLLFKALSHHGECRLFHSIPLRVEKDHVVVDLDTAETDVTVD